MKFEKWRMLKWMGKFISFDTTSGCWVWGGYTDYNGYGRVGITSQKVEFKALAHRAFYIFWIGDIPQGLELDHLCRNRACVNPWHLEPVTRKENLSRGVSQKGIPKPRAQNGATHCIHGHEFTLDNTMITHKNSGYPRRSCIQCARERLDRKSFS